MATRYWVGNVTSNYNDGTNYTGSGNLLTSDDLIFDSTATSDATGTASLSVNSITISNSFSRVFNDRGQAVTIASSASVFASGSSAGSFTSSGNWSVTAGWTFGTDGTVSMLGTLSFVGTTLSTVNTGSRSFNNITCTKTATAGVTFVGNVNLLGNFTVSDTNSQAISWSGYVLSASGNVTVGGTGIHNFGNGITMNGSSTTLWIKSTIGNPTASNCDLVFNGTGITFDCDKALTVNSWAIGVYFKSLTMGVSSSLTATGATSFSLYFTSGTPLILNNNCTLTLNHSGDLYLLAGGSYPFMSVGTGVTFNGTGGVVLANWNANVTCSVPAVTWTGSDYWIVLHSNYGYPFTVNMSGDMDLGSADFYIVGNTATSGATLVFNSNGYNITCNSTKFGRTTGNLTCYWGSSTINIQNFDGAYWASGCSMYMESSTWYCNGNLDLRSTHIIYPGTSKVYITNTSTLGLRSATNNTFNEVEFNAPGKAITLYGGSGASGLYCKDLVMVDGTFVATNFGTVPTGNVYLNGGSLSWGAGGGITSAGTDSTIFISENLESVAISTAGFQINSKTTLIDNYGFTAAYFILLTDATAVINGNERPTTFVRSTIPFTFTNRGTLTINKDMTSVRTAAGAVVALTGVPRIDGTGNLYFINQANLVQSLPSLTFGGDLGVTIDSSYAPGVAAVNWATGGVLNFSPSNTLTISNTGLGDTTFDCNNSINGYPSFRALKTNPLSTRKNYIYWGPEDKTHQFSSWSEEGSLGSYFINVIIKIYVAGSFIGNKDSTYEPGTSTFFFTGDGILNCFDKTTFYDATVNAPDKTLTSVNNFHTARNLTLTQGNFFFDDYTCGVLGNVNLDGTGSLGLGSIFMNNASGTIHIGNTLSDITSNKSSLHIDGTATLDVDKSIQVKSLTLANMSKAVNSGSAVLSLQGPSSPLLQLGDDATFTNNASLELHPYQTTDIISTGARTLIDGSSPINTYLEASSIVGTLSDVTYAGTSSWNFYDNTGFDSTVAFNGNMSLGDNDLNIFLMGYGSARNRWVVNKNITCKKMTVGRENNDSTLTVDYGKGTMSVTSYTTPDLTVSSIIQNFQHSEWNCIGDWTFGSGFQNVTHMTDTFTFTGPGNIKSNNNPFNWLTIQSDTTLQDNLACHWLKNAGTLNQNGYSLRMIGDTHGINYAINS